MSKTKKTAAELLSELNNDASQEEVTQAKNEEKKVVDKLLFHNERSIVAALKKVGVNISSVDDLVNSSSSYPAAIPILVQSIEEKKIEHSWVLEGVIRALAVPTAKGIANKPLLRLYLNSAEDAPYRWAIGNTIEVIMTNDDVAEVIEIVSDVNNGISRQMFVSALGKIKSENAENALIALLEDEEVILHTIDALGKMKSQKAKPIISDLTNSSKGGIRKEAIKALKKINKK